MNNLIKTSLAILIVGAIISGCGKNDNEGSLSITMTDAPAAYEQVNVDIQKVRIHVEGNKKDSGQWIDLATNAGIYNLLALQNGVDTTIVSAVTVKGEKITQMRLVLGTNNTVVVGGTSYPMKVPSGSESGIKLVGEITLDDDEFKAVQIDFDAAQSVVQSGNGEYHLKPVIKVVQ